MQGCENEVTDYEKLEELLNSYSNLDIEIREIELKVRGSSLRGIELNGMPKGNNVSSPIENELIYVERLENEKIYLQIKKESINNMLNLLDDFEKNLIELRYFKKLQYKQISYELNISEL
ncbi:TPA: sigma-70 family RNA polymerase sigma factor, partial [Clostridioides difficile]|nr:sigma-70 family RNA polymerase sigma factor [Clostridioides difficile]